jgi:hypothetical protein
MKILLVFEKEFPIDGNKLLLFLKQNLKHIKFVLYKKEFIIEDEIITDPSTLKKTYKNFQVERNQFDEILCFSEKQYSNNYFFMGYKNFTIFSFYGWPYLTNLPKSNGVLYFIIDYLALGMDTIDFRHYSTTGCIYDFLEDKSGIDEGMRQARYCNKCLERLTQSLQDKTDIKNFEDLKTLMNRLSEASRWNNDVLAYIKVDSGTIEKRTPKSNDGIHVVIASSGDTASLRKILLDSLERRFRTDNCERHCGFRIMVSGWEDLSSQNGYPQNVINKKIIEKSDFVISVFKHKLGTPTKNLVTGKKRAESGTVEELLQALDNNNSKHPIGMAYFYSTPPEISLDAPEIETIFKEWKRLGRFKDSIKDKMIYKPFANEDELLTMTLKDLENNIIDYIIK